MLSAWDLTKGKPLWSRKTHADFNPPDAYFGVGSTPLVEGKMVLANVGGRNQAGIVAFDLASGKTVWSSTDDAASYSSPIAVTRDGVRHAVLHHAAELRVARSGEWPGTLPHRVRPAADGERRQPGDGRRRRAADGELRHRRQLIQLGKDSARTLWEDEVLSSQYATPIVDHGLLYGVDGRQDGGPVALPSVSIPNPARFVGPIR